MTYLVHPLLISENLYKIFQEDFTPWFQNTTDMKYWFVHFFVFPSFLDTIR